jgi:hypothetical protein
MDQQKVTIEFLNETIKKYQEDVATLESLILNSDLEIPTIRQMTVKHRMRTLNTEFNSLLDCINGVNPFENLKNL